MNDPKFPEFIEACRRGEVPEGLRFEQWAADQEFEALQQDYVDETLRAVREVAEAVHARTLELRRG